MTIPAGNRHAARELALQMLFQIDVGRVPIAEVLEGFEADDEIAEPPASAIVYAHELVRGTARNVKQIDRLLASLTDEWAFDRLASVDRNILRMAVYECFYTDDVPEEIVINEAVELAKEYSTQDSGKFVNGLLGTLARRRAAGELVLPSAEPPVQPPPAPPASEPAASSKRKRRPLSMGPDR